MIYPFFQSKNPKNKFLACFFFLAGSIYGQNWKPLGPWGAAVVDGIAGDSGMLVMYGNIGSTQLRCFGSYDRGESWQLLKGGLNSAGTSPLLTKFGNTFYAQYLIGNQEILVSSDSIRNWSSVPNYNGGELPVLSLANNRLICLDNRSITDGSTFQYIPERKQLINLFSKGNLLFGCVPYSDSLFTSQDFGDTWVFKSLIGNGYYQNTAYYGNNSGALNFVLPSGAIFIRNSNSSIPGPFLRSLNDGLTWSPCNDGLPLLSNSGNPFAAIQNTIFTGNSNGVFRSADLGVSWEGINTPVPGTAIRCMYSVGGRLLLGTDRGLYKSDNLGEDWVETGTGYQAETVSKTISSQNRLLAIANTGGTAHKYRSSDGGQQWQFSGFHNFSQELTAGASAGDTCLLWSRGSGLLYYSGDFGESWSDNQFFDEGFTSNISGFSFHKKKLFLMRQANFDAKSYLMRSGNFGLSWDTAYSFSEFYYYSYMAVSRDKLYQISSNGAIPKFIRSDNNGDSWTAVTLPSSFQNITINQMVAKGDSIFITTTDPISPALRSFNKGQTWTAISSLGGASNSTLFQLLEHNGVLYLSTGNGIFRCSWNNSWSSITGNLMFPVGTVFTDMQIKGDSLIVAVDGNGLWYTSLCQASANAINLTPCAGSLVQLLATGGGSYSWTGPGNFSSTQQNPLIQNISTANSGTYTVNVVTPGGCNLQRSVSIAVQPGAGNLTLSAPAVCTGQTLQLGVSGGSGTYQWTGPGGFSFSIQNPTRDSITAADSGYYTVTVTAANGCQSTKSIYVSVPYLPRANMLPVSNLTPCNLDTIRLDAAFRLSGVRYQWYRNNVALSQDTLSKLPATQSGKYHYVYQKGICQSRFADTIVLAFSGFRNPRKPVLQINPIPTTCLQQFTIQSSASGTYGRKWFKDGEEIEDAIGVNYSGNQLGNYYLRVDTIGGCFNTSNPVSVQVSGAQSVISPKIFSVSVDLQPENSQRCMVSWYRNTPLDTDIQHVIILRQSDSQAGVYDSVGIAQNIDSLWVDPVADPRNKPYFYKIQARAICPGNGTFLSIPSEYHKITHLQISKAPAGNIYNLLWSPYEGFPVSNYEIFRGLSESSANQLIGTVAGNINSFTDLAPSDSTYFYRIEVNTGSSYFPWGRIAARPRKSKSNTRPTIQSIPGGDSTSVFDIVNSAIPYVDDSGQLLLYPSPSFDGSFIVSFENIILNLQLYNSLGQEVSAVTNRINSQSMKVELAPAQSPGLYFVRIHHSHGFKMVRWLYGRN